MALISIIIPTFNNVEFIDQTLQSILKKPHSKQYEILVGIDECYLTLQLIKPKIHTYPPNITFYFFKTNVGPYLIKNSLVQIAKSEKILFFDSDDIFYPTAIPQIIKALEQCDLVRFLFNSFLGKKYLIEKPKIYAQGVFGIRRKIFLDQNGFEPWRCAADSDFMERTVQAKIRLGYIQSPLFMRRVHPTSLTQNAASNNSSDMRKCYHEKIHDKKILKAFFPLGQFHTESFEKITPEWEAANIVLVTL
jgi:glycosyltransferase involved in cell wall biosynthesis